MLSERKSQELRRLQVHDGLTLGFRRCPVYLLPSQTMREPAHQPTFSIRAFASGSGRQHPLFGPTHVGHVTGRCALLPRRVLSRCTCTLFRKLAAGNQPDKKPRRTSRLLDGSHHGASSRSSSLVCPDEASRKWRLFSSNPCCVC